MGIGRPRILRSRLIKEESGWLIVEVMIGAVTLVLGALAIYWGLDGASKASGRNRNRSEASYLAQKDQERMRALDAGTLAALAGTTKSYPVTVPVGNGTSTTFTVKSTVSLVDDSTGAVGCTNKSSTAQYLELSSSVADPTNQNKPVVEDSLLSPRPGDGNAAVQIFDRNGKGVQGIDVTLQEPPGSTVTTDSSGCSLFGLLDTAQQYDVAFSEPGYVNENGVNAVEGPITVVPAAVSVTSFQYDKAGSITGTLPTTGVCAGISVTHVNMTVSPKRVAVDNSNSSCDPTVTNVTAATPHANTVPNLFPFTSAYAVYAGECTQNDPKGKWGQAATFTSGALTPGGSASPSGSLPEPPLNLTVKQNGTALSNAHVLIKENANDISLDGNCANNVFTEYTNSSGQLPLPGIPYGNWDICADNNNSSAPLQASTTNVQNGSPSGTSAVTLNITNFSSRRLCT